MGKPVELDNLDLKILALLMQNAKRPYTDIAKELFVSGGTIHVRMKKMEESGVVQGQHLVVDPSRLGYDICA
jgi:Lrp/AsnC family transcriptional regulator for asnA, asnC and gidA